MTDNTTAFAFDTWWALYDGLKGTSWEDEDFDLLRFYKNDAAPTAPAAEAMQYAYTAARTWEGPVDPEDAVAAVLVATYEFHASNEWTPLRVKEMADHFAVFYRDMDEPLQDRLDDFYSRMDLSWLGDHGRKELEREVRRPSEIWLDGDGPTGVWVFNKPGRAV